jgi:hypothetical protein
MQNYIIHSALKPRALAMGLLLSVLLFAGLPAAHTYAYPNSPLPAQPGFAGGKVLGGLSAWYGSPTLADINKDGKLEIIFGGADGWIYAVSSSGALLWQVDGTALINAVAPHPSATRVESAPAVADVDGDGWPEIAVSLDPGAGVGNANGGVILLRHDGTVMPGWPQLGLDHERDGYPNGFWSSPALGDVDGDGKLEIVAGGWDQRVHVWRYDGTELPGWPRFTFDTVWSSPALADVNRDGKQEIIVGTDAADGGYLHVYRADGSDLPGFPKHIDQTIYSSPAVADLNGDGWPDIVVGTGNFYPGRGNAVYAWDSWGNPLPGWPVATGGQVMSSPSVGDIDGDGKPEVVVGANDSKVYAFHGNGSPVAGWPVVVQDNFGQTAPLFYASPVLANFDADPYPEVYINQFCDTVVLDGNGQYLSQQGNTNVGKPSMYMVSSWCQANTPAVADIDGDGLLEVVRAGGTTSQPNGNGRAELYVWQTQRAPVANQWSMFRRSPEHLATYKSVPALDARIVSHDLPAIMKPGETRTIHLTVENTGSTAWTRGAAIRLGSGGDDGFWQNARVELATGETIAAGQQKAFTFQLTAPTTPGYYPTFWRMLQEGVTPFGLAAFRQIKVGNEPAYYVLTKVNNGRTGAVYAGGLAPDLTPPATFWNWPESRSFAFLTSGRGYQMLDSQGGIWQGGMAQPMYGTGGVASSAARQILLKRDGTSFYVLDAFGNLQNSFGAPPFSPAAPTFGDGRIRSGALTPNERGVYLLAGDGTISRGGSAALLSPATPYFGADMAKKIKLTKSGAGYYVLDAWGRLWSGGNAPALSLNYALHVGEDWARDFALTADEKGFYMLDKEGGIHVGGTAVAPSIHVPPTWPGQDVALELAVVDSATVAGVQIATQNVSVLAVPNQVHAVGVNVTSASVGTSWTAQSDVGWVTVSPTSGVTPATLILTVKTTSLGDVVGHVTINSPSNPTPTTITVRAKTVSHLNYTYLPVTRR